MSAERFIEACGEGKLSEVQDMVKEGVDIDIEGERGARGLLSALIRERFEVATWLLSQEGVDTNWKHPEMEGRTYLHLACMSGSPVEVVTKLLETMDTELVNAKHDGGKTALDVAVSDHDKGGFDSENGHERQGPIVEVLAGREEITWDLERLEEVARSENRNAEDMLALLQRIDREKREKRERKFVASCKRGPAGEVSSQLSHHPELLNCLGGKPLKDAALGRNMEVLEVLMGFKELQLNLRDENERTALHTAAATNLAELVLKFLKHPDIDVNLASRKGSTPAMEAARNGNLESLKVLLEDDRVDLDKEDEDGKTLENIAANEQTGQALVFFQDARRRQGIRDE